MDTKKVKESLMRMSETVRMQRPGFFKRIQQTSEPVGVARSFAKAYMKTNGDLHRVLKSRYPEWSHDKVTKACSQYPNIYDLTCYIVYREGRFKTSGMEDHHPDVVSNVLGGFSEIGLFNYLELNGELDNLIGSSHLGKDVVYGIATAQIKKMGLL